MTALSRCGDRAVVSGGVGREPVPTRPDVHDVVAARLEAASQSRENASYNASTSDRLGAESRTVSV